jgi:hypothetical protein
VTKPAPVRLEPQSGNPPGWEWGGRVVYRVTQGETLLGWIVDADEDGHGVSDASGSRVFGGRHGCSLNKCLDWIEVNWGARAAS